jgi:Tfp pilus assembly protein PilO
MRKPNTEPQNIAPSRQNDDAPKIKRPSKVFTEYYSSIILILITVLVSAGYLVIKPKMDEYKDLRANIQTIGQNIENQRNYLSGISRSVAAAQSISPDVLSQVERALPRSFSIPEILVILNRAAKASSIEVGSIVFSAGNARGPAIEKNGLQSVQLTLNVSAPSYQSLKQFLNTLESSLRLFDVQMITVSDFKEGKAAFSLQLRTYYYAGGSAKQ